MCDIKFAIKQSFTFATTSRWLFEKSGVCIYLLQNRCLHIFVAKYMLNWHFWCKKRDIAIANVSKDTYIYNPSGDIECVKLLIHMHLHLWSRIATPN